jgi:predicted Zn-dependent protease
MDRGNMHIKTLFALAALLSLTACVTNPMTGRSQLSIVPEKTVMAKGAEMYSSLLSSYDKNGKLVTDDALNTRLRTVTNRLVEQAILYRPDARDWSWQISVIDNPEINASCLPGGKMFIHTGFMEKIAPTDDELAQVMGHEISHALANHGAEKMSVQILAGIAAATVAVAASAATYDPNRPASYNRSNQRAIGDTSALAAAAFVSLPNSRGAEEEADKLGIELAARAGYHPEAAVSLWKKMIEQTGQTSRTDFMSTHPASPKRVEFLESMQAPMMRIYEERKPLYANYSPAYDYVQSGTTSSNVREITSADLVAKPEIDASKSLVFYSEEFERFKAGDAVLDCGGECALGFFGKQKELRKHHDESDWRQLATKVLKTRYKIDLAYFYLGKAAEGLGFTDAAKAYFSKAIELSATDGHACSKAVMIKCEDMDIAALSAR